MLDDGRLTDGHGRTVDFKNAVLVMTSNISSSTQPASSSNADPAEPGRGENLRDILRAHFKAEFINRLDEVVEFKALTRDQIGEIVGLQVDRVARRLAERGVELVLTSAACELIGDLGYDPVYGARPLKRVIQKQLVDRLALALLDGALHEGERVSVDALDGQLTFDGLPRDPALAAARG